MGNAYLGSPEEFVDHCIEPTDSSPYVRAVGRRLLEEQRAHGILTEYHIRERRRDEE